VNRQLLRLGDRQADVLDEILHRARHGDGGADQM
jgi:hypothetical protein